MTDHFRDVYTLFCDITWDPLWNEQRIREALEKIAAMLNPHGGNDLVKLLDGYELHENPISRFESHEALLVEVIGQIKNPASKYMQQRIWEAARGLSIADLNGITDALSRQIDTAKYLLETTQEDASWLSVDQSFQLHLLTVQLSTIESMLSYRINLQLLTGPIPRLHELDAETVKRLTKAVSGKVSADLMKETVLKVHDHIDGGMSVTKAIGKALEWLADEEHGEFIGSEKTVRRWAIDLDMKWW